MKSTIVKLCSAFIVLAFVACNNETKEEKTAQPETGTSTPATKEEPKKTEISVGPDGAEIKTKDGNEIKVDEGGASAGTKGVKIKVATKDTIKK